MITTIVPAAGKSERFGANKLLQSLHGKPLLRHALESARKANVGEICLVTGQDAAQIVEAAGDLADQIIHNSDYASGIGSSIARGVSACRDTSDAVLLLLADQPLVTDSHLRRMVEAWSGSVDEIVATSYDDTIGPPVLFPTGAFDDLTALAGDNGGKAILTDDRFQLRELGFTPAGRDVDTPEDLRTLATEPQPVSSVGEHPRDQFGFLLDKVAAGHRCALVTIVGIVDTASRNPGTHMIVADDGQYAGSVSSGCVDANVAAFALDALEKNESQRVQLGAGSCFVDIALPCGGGMDLLIVPDPDTATIADVCARLDARERAVLTLAETGIEFVARYQPPLKLILAGRGAELTSFCEIARACRYPVVALSPNANDVTTCNGFGADAVHVVDPRTPPELEADPCTAIVLLFHDHDWESGILKAALESDAFYIGALGSKKTHAARLEMLAADGIPREALDRIKGPIGLVPSMRNAPMLAISTLAEIIEQFNSL